MYGNHGRRGDTITPGEAPEGGTGALGLGAPPPCPTDWDPGGNRVSGSSSGGLWTAGEGKVESKGTTFFSLYCTASGGSRARWQQFCGS